MPTPKIDSRVSPAMLHILLALAEEEVLHGYSIMRTIEARTEGRVEVGPGTLYRTLGHLLDRGWIEEVPGEDGAKRRYSLTPAGRAVASREARSLSALVEWAKTSDLLAEAD